MQPTPAMTYEAPAAAGGIQKDVDLRSVFTLLWARRLLILSIVFLITFITALIVLQQKSQYTATSVVMLDTRKQQVVDFESVVSGLTVDDATVQSEMAILSSRKLAYRVVEKLGLQRDPEFNPNVRDINNSLLLKYPAGQAVLKFFGIETPTPEEYPVSRVVSNVLKKFDIYNDGKSYAIAISFTSESPQKAADIANAWSDQYLVDQLEVKYEATKRANQWLNERLSQLEKKVTETEGAVAKAKEQANIVKTDDGFSIASRQLGEINSQLILAETQRSEAESKLRDARGRMAANSGYDSVLDVLSSPLIQSLREQESTVVQAEQDLANRYGDRHPSLVSKRAEIREVRAKIREETNRILGSLESDLNRANSKVATLRSQLARTEARINTMNRSQISIDRLERDANANRTLYDTFLNRFKQTFAQDDLQQADARIVQQADVPERPSKPKRKLIVITACFASFLLAMFIVFILEAINNTVRNLNDLESVTGLKGFAMIPRIAGGERKLLVPYLQNNPTSVYSEGIRSVLTSLQFARPDRPVQAILVTSSVPEEGKSFFSLSLANVAALGGKKVLLIDCDLRRPTIAKQMNHKPKSGLADYLAGFVSMQDIVFRDQATGVDYCFTAGNKSIPQTLLASERMQALLDHARQLYDYIIIDSPPLMAVSDALVLAPMMDYVVYAVRYDKTPRKVVKNALRQLAYSARSYAGCVLTQVDLKKHSRYDYGDAGYYYGRYGNYYESSSRSS